MTVIGKEILLLPRNAIRLAAALLVLFCSLSLSGQAPPPVRPMPPPQEMPVPLSLDSTYRGIRVFDEVIIIGKYTPMSYEDYWRLKRRIIKVWPYAVLASQYLYEMDSLRGELSKRKFQKTVNQRQKELFDNFAGILKKFTRTEGKILIKLVYRQTGVSTYDIARELKSGFKAFWWNASAGMFSLSLKDEYDPRRDAEDYSIENILRKCFAEGELPPYPAYNEFSSPFYYRKVEQDIARDRKRNEELDKLEKKRERQLKRRDRKSGRTVDTDDLYNMDIPDKGEEE